MIDETSIDYSLGLEPRSLIDPKNKLVLMWSAKSGCTFAIKWFLFQMDLLDEANEMYWWVHSYREKVFYDKPFYAENIQEIVKDPEYKVIKVTRDPYTRVVSSYIHAMRFGYENEPLSKYLERPIDEENSFSFREFLDYLKNDCYIRRCNIHHQRQYHPLEENGLLKVDFHVKLEDSMTRFGEIEKELGLKTFDLVSIRKQPHHTEKIEFDSFCADTKFTKEMIEDGKKVPDYKMFYNQEIENLVKEIYSEDLEHYGYQKTIV
ncbi:MAG: sulfotransferase family 2 domain-containing protein [Cyclobacteriaceae bacterium]